jgi:hypothetical protein
METTWEADGSPHISIISIVFHLSKRLDVRYLE